MDQEKKRTRGKGVKPALVHLNVRLSPWVAEFYRQQPNYTAFMRDVLTKYAIDNESKPEEGEVK